MARQTLVKLMSSDNEIFEVPEAEGCMSATVKIIIEDMGTEAPVPFPNMSSKDLAKVIEYCKYHVENGDEPNGQEAVEEWQKEFLSVDQATLFDLQLGANYLNTKSLLDLRCKTFADMIKGKMPEEIQKTFGIENDLTPEEAEVQRKNEWAFEGFE